MPYKDKDKQKAYQREYQRLRRAGQPPKEHGLKVLQPVNPEQIRTAQSLLRILGHLIGEVLETKEGDVFLRSRTAGYLISIGLKAVEVADLEVRLANLENKISGDKI